MFRVEVGGYTLHVQRGPLPDLYGEYRRRATLAEEFDLSSGEGDTCFVAVGAPNDWPSLVVAQRFSPFQGGFDPGALLVPETKVLFIGTGTRLLAYSLYGPRRLWEDRADVGFWSWARHGNHVLMSAEIELAAWEISGTKRWSTFVEPPWEYRVADGRVLVHDDRSGHWAFPLATGPAWVSASPRYRPLDRERDWYFFHTKAAVPEAVLPLIQPMTEDFCRAMWEQYISLFPKPAPDAWLTTLFRDGRQFTWYDDWYAGRTERIARLLQENLPWSDDAEVYFLWSERRGVATQWRVFRDHWTSFLFDDEFPILLNPRRREVATFGPNDYMCIGTRPDWFADTENGA